MTDREHGELPTDAARRIGGTSDLAPTAPHPAPTQDAVLPTVEITRPPQNPWQPGEDIVSLRGGVGLVDNIRRDGRRASFTMRRPGEPPEDLWVPIRHFDQRLRDGDWAKIQDFGEGPPEPDWVHSEVRRILPPSDEPPPHAVHVEPRMLTGAVFGEMVTVYGAPGESFARFRERDTFVSRGGWHRPDAWAKWDTGRHEWSDAQDAPIGFELEALLELWYNTWQLTYHFFREHPGHFAESP